jgi:isoamylase
MPWTDKLLNLLRCSSVILSLGSLTHAYGTVVQLDMQKELYVAFNASHLPVMVSLPERPGFKWYPLVDTSKPSPYDFLTDDVPNRAVALAQSSSFLNAHVFPMLNYSSIILILVPETVF